MVFADDLVPTWHQDIPKYHDNIDMSVHVMSALM